MLENLESGQVALPTPHQDVPKEQAGSWGLSRTTVRNLLAMLVVALAVWLPRAFQLDHFVTVDESKWLVRSANFYEALSSGQLEHAFQHGHPGVTIMYAGMAGYLWKFPDYVDRVDEQHRWGDEFMEMIDGMGHKPIDMLAAGRTFVVIINALALAFAFLYAIRLIGFLPAFLAFLLIALDPFQTALARFLHPDSLLSTFMLLATLAFMAYLFAGRRLRDLIVAGVVTALAWLTKTPAVFLIPLMGLLALIEAVVHVVSQPNWRGRDLVGWTALGRVARTLAIWAAVAVGVYFLLWPALWVNARWTLTQVFDISSDYALQGHSSPVFFNGRIYNGDPGLAFYPINYLWRTTPVIMLGVLLLIPGFWQRDSQLRRRRVWLTMLGLACFAFFFLVFMTLAEKKFDRYLLPVFMPMDILAALGWAALIAWLFQMRAAWARPAAIGLAALVVGVQAWQSLPTFPYYMSYYNPVMGGPAKAEEVMFIGWGEGLDEAARYLNTHTDVKNTAVASWYERGPFSFFYDGQSSSNRHIWETDYSVIYNHQWQRELPSRRMLAYFDTLTPEHSIWLNDLEYVRIYNMQDAPPPDYMVEWGDSIRLVYYDTFSGAMYPGQRFDMTMYFVKTAPLDIDYSILVRMVNQDGHELLRQEGKPNGMPTSTWPLDEILRDNSISVRIPEGTPPGLYRIEVSFYDPATFDRLPVRAVNTGELVAEPFVLDYLIVGDWPAAPAARLNPPVQLGDQVTLYGAEITLADGKTVKPDGLRLSPGQSLDLRLFWEANTFIRQDYTVFIHLLGPDGTPITQGDSQPMGGFIPTNYWPPHQRVADVHTLAIPDDAPPGEYRLVVGWYDLETMQRLPMTQGDESIGDAFPLATWTVQ